MKPRCGYCVHWPEKNCALYYGCHAKYFSGYKFSRWQWFLWKIEKLAARLKGGFNHGSKAN